VSLLHIHGTADDNVPLAGGRGTAGVSNADFTPVLAAVSTFASADGCGPPPAPVYATPGDPRVQVRDWPGCPQGISVELLTVEGAGHPWMPDSTDRIWGFLAAHPAPP